VNAEYINPILKATLEILKNIGQSQITKGRISLLPEVFTLKDVVCITGVTGAISGQVIFNCDEKLGCTLASNIMLGLPFKKLDKFARDSISEIINRICSKATENLKSEGFSCKISPVSVFLSEEIEITLENMRAICVPLNLKSGTFYINIALKRGEY